MFQLIGAGGIVGAVATVLTMISIYTAIRLLIKTAILILLPVVLYNSSMYLLEKVLDYVGNYLSGTSLSQTVIELSGIAGYLGSHLKIAESISIVMTAVLCNFLFSFLKK